jgi:hypothetical protein
MHKPRKTKKKVSLQDLYDEVRALRRDIELFVPTEALDEYKNKHEITEAYQEARNLIARSKRG